MILKIKSLSYIKAHVGVINLIQVQYFNGIFLSGIKDALNPSPGNASLSPVSVLGNLFAMTSIVFMSFKCCLHCLHSLFSQLLYGTIPYNS